MAYAFNFDTAKGAIKLSTQNLNYLISCEEKVVGVLARVDTPERLACLRGTSSGQLFTQEMADREVVRLEAAIKDIVKRLSKDEKLEYKAYNDAIKAPKELTAEEQAAIIKQLDENRDKPSH